VLWRFAFEYYLRKEKKFMDKEKNFEKNDQMNKSVDPKE